jgi:hypothetical protein
MSSSCGGAQLCANTTECPQSDVCVRGVCVQPTNFDGGFPGFDGGFPGFDGGFPGFDGGFPALDGATD